MSFNQQQQNVDAQYNAGRDQIIQNIIVMGQFLDFANIQELIPKQATSPDFTTIDLAVENTFTERLDKDLVNGMSFVGATLKKIVAKYIPKKQNALPTATFNVILEEIFRTVVDKIYDMNYQIHFSVGVPTIFSSITGDAQKVLWLESLNSLWAKHFQKDEKECNFAIFIQPPDYKFRVSMVRISRNGNFPIVDFSNLNIEQTRVMMVGLVLDLLRWQTMGTSYLKFWQSLTDLITKETKKEPPASNNSEKSA